MMLFALDGVKVPTPAEWLVNNKIISKDSERIPETLELIQNMKGTLYEISWVYKNMSQDQFDILYNLYIINTINSKNPNHTLITCDSNSNDIFEFEIYTQDDFTAPIYMINPKTGKRYYKELTFTFVSRTTKKTKVGTWDRQDIRNSRVEITGGE